MKKNALKHFTFIMMTVIVMFAVTGCQNETVKKEEEVSNVKQTAMNQDNEEQANYTLEVHNDYIAILPKDVYKISDVVIEGTYQGDTKVFADNELGNPITEGKVHVDKIIKGECDKEEINIQFYGGVIPFQEYLSVKGEEETKKLGLTGLTKQQKLNSTVELSKTKEMVTAKEGEKYLIFLVADTETDTYFVGCDAYGMRSKNAEGKFFNPDTQQYETIDFAEIG